MGEVKAKTFQGFSHNDRWWHEVKKEDRVLWNWDLFYRGDVDAGVDEGYQAAIFRVDKMRGTFMLPKWIPSIHMPKWVSRMKLRVKRVWVERVQDIGAMKGQLLRGSRLMLILLHVITLFSCGWNCMGGRVGMRILLFGCVSLS